MTTIHDLEPPATVLTSAQRRHIVATIDREGLRCVCGDLASDRDVDAFVAEVEHDPEPVPYICETCAGCDDCGGDHAAGSTACPWEVA